MWLNRSPKRELRKITVTYTKVETCPYQDLNQLLPVNHRYKTLLFTVQKCKISPFLDHYCIKHTGGYGSTDFSISEVVGVAWSVSCGGCSGRGEREKNKRVLLILSEE